MERFAQKAAEAISPFLPNPIQGPDLEIPPDRSMGDFAFPCFKLSKELRKAPPQIAQEIAVQVAEGAKKLGLHVQAKGPYVNFVVPPQEAFRLLLKDILEGKENGHYGAMKPKSRGKWIIEFSSPNVAKPMHVGHLRTTVLGAALSRIGSYRGFDVIRINHLGDWGTQFGKLTVAIKRFGKDLPASPSINDLLALYIRFHTEAEKDPTLEDEAREAFHRLEAGDIETRKLWKKCLDASWKEFEAVYRRLNVQFDHIWGESFYEDKMGPFIQNLEKKGLLVESEGALVVPVSDEKGNELPPCIIKKKDGSTIYATRDLAAAFYRYETFHFDRMSYVVGGEQKLHFQQVFSVLRKAGYAWVNRCEHIPFGLYRFKDAKLSTRKGNVVTLHEVLEATKEKVIELLKERRPELAESERLDISESVAIGAVVFFDLSTDPVKDVSFDLDRVADFEGETGPYLQYAHTRCVSILRKTKEEGFLSSDQVGFEKKYLDQLVHPAEAQLVKRLGLFPIYLERTLNFAKPSQLTTYLIDVVKDFGFFYRECRVMTENRDLTLARLQCVEATRRILAQGLTCLGVPLPAKM